MLYHFITLEFTDDATEEAKSAAWVALSGLPAKIPEIRKLTGGLDIGITPGSKDLAFVAEFDDEAAWRTYQAHEAHQEVIDKYLKPVLAGRSSVQVVSAK